MNGPCTECGKDSGDCPEGGSLWQPPDSDPKKDVKRRTRVGVVVEVPRALCARCRRKQDDGVSPWRSA